ncbi:hypothetical protein OFO01_07140 [Campylobacter sp. JMF_01 NE2]|uniref:hypothetical protein n=1 Tax=unclassified Campylobacter TaxID=2593542 RepID=UPI0022E9FBA1|nr:MULTISPECIES: hypothetical protein [unclassified Campylobacter]MDA3053262.1 hypothetical protein [Campylobacter sp. JMF_03 NE3]MDA3067555.1 hypothetical protein [Campylobacter sp. JMF_01 NE2]
MRKFDFYKAYKSYATKTKEPLEFDKWRIENFKLVFNAEQHEMFQQFEKESDCKYGKEIERDWGKADISAEQEYNLAFYRWREIESPLILFDNQWYLERA